MKTIQGHLLIYTSPLQLSHFPVAISRAGNGVYPSDSHTAMLRKALEACLRRAFCVLDLKPLQQLYQDVKIQAERVH